MGCEFGLRHSIALPDAERLGDTRLVRQIRANIR